MKKLNWVKRHRVLTACIGSATIALVTLAIANPDLIGLGADSTTNIERDNKGNVIKTVEIQQSAKTLWDLLQLFGNLALPLLLLLLANRFQEQEKKAQEIKQQSEKEIAEDNQRGQALETYLDRISNILLDQSIAAISDRQYAITLDIIRARTLEILRRFGRDANNVDGVRKGRVLQFLYDVELISNSNETLEADSTEAIKTDKPLLDLVMANFSGANLSYANLSSADLSSVDLSYADLRGADLRGAYLNGAYLLGTNLSGANLSGAYIVLVTLKGADLSNVKLSGAYLNNVYSLESANLSGAKYDEKTTLPKDFDPELNGMVKEIKS